ncbi:hypothetical protein NUACC21_40120 [Scytonema sp. NUACC21]
MEQTKHITQNTQKNYNEENILPNSDRENLNIVFIDTAVSDYQNLISGVKPGSRIVILDPTKDGIAQITESLQEGKYQSVHIVSHGAKGTLQLGATQLNSDTLNLYTKQLQQWANALTDDANILLYGCDVASGEIGQAFVQELAQITGADVTASDDTTGSAQFGGDWDLEVKTGQIESGIAFTPAATKTYKAILPLSFASSNVISGTAKPQSLTTGDFNKDGYFDLAVVQQTTTSHSVVVLLGDGSAGFDNIGDYAVGTNPVFVTTGLLNSDAQLDLIVANSGSNSVSILFNNGDGNFGSATSIPVGGLGANPTSAIAGDFDKDGDVDLAVTTVTTNSSNVAVLLNNGNGSFVSAANYAVGSNPQSIVVGDFNNNGILDLAVANFGSGTVSVLSGRGNGTFIDAVNYTVGSNPKSIVTGDFNSDGRLDIAVAKSSSDRVAVLLGRDNGTFGTAVDFNTGANPSSLTIADFNKDGKSDLVVANSGAATLSILLGDGGGSFSSPININVGSNATNPISVATADFDGDNKFDIAVANAGSNNVAVLLNVSTNAAPINKVPVTPQTTNEETTLVFNSANNNLISISDEDANNNLVEVKLTSTNGILSLGSTTGITTTGNNTGSINIVGTVTNINNSLNGLSFTPTPNFNGSATIRIVTNDQGFTGADGAKTDSDPFSVEVTSINDAPMLLSDAVTVYAEADTWVDLSNTQANYGNSTTLNAGSQSEAYIRFNLNSLPFGIADITNSATLRLTGSTAATSGNYTHNLYSINNDTWSENLMTWATKPVYEQTGNWQLGFNSGSSIQQQTVNVMPQVLPELVGNRRLSFVINNSNTPGNQVNYFSRENTATLNYVPQLTLSLKPISPIAIDEDDTNNSGTLVSNIISGRIADADSGAFRGIAVIGSNNQNGQWQYSSDGSTWSDFGTVSTSSALLLAADSNTKIRFVPNKDFFGTVTGGITFRAWDRTSGENAMKADTTNNGASTAFSSSTATAEVIVNPVNDAPVINVPTALSASEDTLLTINNNNGGVISISDIDAGNNPVQVKLDASNGTISLNGTTGLTFSNGSGNEDTTMTFTGTLASVNNALAGMKFRPKADFVGTGKVDITVNDLGNTGSGKPETAASSASITINPINDAPINTVPNTVQTAEDTALIFSADKGNQILISDVDALTSSIQVTLVSANGTFTVGNTTDVTTEGNNSNSIILTGAISNINAALNGLSFTPTPNFNGNTTIEVTANDKGNSGGEGEKIDKDIINVSVTPVNDAPVLLSNAVAIAPPINEDDTNNGGTLVSSIVADLVSDSDLQALKGIAIVQSNNTNGYWQYSTNGGSLWTDFGNISPTSTLLLAADGNTKVRFLPKTNFVGTIADGITFRGWDQTNRNPDVTNNGGITAFSSSTATASITVNPVNDAPIINAPSAFTTNEDTPLIVDASSGVISIQDVDAGENSIDVTLTATSGTISLSGNTGLTFKNNSSDGIEDATMTFSGTIANINAALLGMKFHPANNSVNAGKIDITVDDKDNTGNGEAENATTSITVNINPVNDAPVHTVPTTVQKTNEDTALIFSDSKGNQIRIDDVDALSNPMEVTLTATDGILSLGSNNRVSAQGNNTGKVIVTGAIADINNALNGLSFTPKLNYSGNAVIEITTNDKNNTDLGGEKTTTSTINVTVDSFNDAPVLVSDTVPLYAEADSWVTSLSPNRNYGSNTLLNVSGVRDGEQRAYLRFNLNSLPKGIATALQSATFQMTGNSTASSGEDSHVIYFVSDDAWQENLITWNNKPSYNSSLGSWSIAYNNGIQKPTLDISSQVLAELTGNQKLSLVAMQTDFSKPGFVFSYQSRENQKDVPQLNLTLKPISLAAIDEDNTNSDGTLVSALLAGRVIDTDAEAVQGIAVIGGDNTNGKWQYSITGGQWVDFGTVSETSARLLAADGTTKVRFVPNENFNGKVTNGLTFRLWDRSDNNSNGSVGNTVKNGSDTPFSSGIAYAEITINPVNDASVINAPATTTINEDTTLVFSADKGGVISISDVDAGVFPVEVTLKALNGNGSISLSGTKNLNFTNNIGDGIEDTIMTFTGTIADINTALAGMQFNPKANFFDTETIEITVNDQGKTGNGGAKTTTRNVTVDVTSINDAPVNTITTKELVILEDTPIIFNENNRISISDIDAGDNKIRVSLIATNGTITLSDPSKLEFSENNSDGIDDIGMTFKGTIADINAALLGMRFNPTPNYFGSASIEILTNDLGNSGNPKSPDENEALRDVDTVNITITSVNDPPINTVPAALTTDEDKPIVFNKENGNLISISDADARENPIQVQLIATNGTIALSTTSGLQVTEGSINGMNNARITVRGTIAAINSALAGMSFNPTPNYSGSASVEIITNDLQDSSSTPAEIDRDKIEITVNPLNDSPVHNLPKALSTFEDTPLVFSESNSNSISISDVDAGTNQVEVELVAANGSLSLSRTTELFFSTGDGIGDNWMIFRGTLDSINAALAEMSFNPTANFFGEGSITIKTNDLGNSGGSSVAVTDTIKINIQPTNEPPVNSVPITAQTTIANTPLVFNQANNNRFSIGDVDAFNNPVKVTLTATNGTLSLKSTTGLTFVDNIGDGTNDAVMTFTGTVENINAALDGMSFNPLADYSGPGKVEILTNDQGYTGINGASGALTDPDSVDITIIPVVSITPFDATANESSSSNDSGTATFRISRTGKIGNLTVNLAIDNASTASLNDYTANIANQGIVAVAIPEGQDYVDVILTPIDDVLPEGEESVQLNLAESSSQNYVIDSAKSNAKVTIAANDAITYNIAPNLSTISLNEGQSGIQTLTFTITRSGGIGVASQVNYGFEQTEGTATFGSDYNNLQVAGGATAPSLSGVLDFAVGETSKTITVDILGDSTYEPNEAIIVVLSNPNLTDPPVNSTITTNKATVEITNDDSKPTISIDDVTLSEGNTATFNVTLSNPSDREIAVDYDIVDRGITDGTATFNVDYTVTPLPGGLIFTPGETSKTISITALIDSQFEDVEKFSVKLANPSPSATIADDTGIGTINFPSAIGGTASADTLVGTKDNDRILGLEGDDSILGGLGFDEIDAGDGDDTVFGDLVVAVADTTFNNSDVIKGGKGSDLIYGGDGKDWLYGEAGDDLLQGNDGDDELWGGQGRDYLTGGKGNDIFVLTRNEGTDTINDFRVGEDVIGLSGGLTYSGLSMTQVLSDTFIFENSSQKLLAMLTGVQASALSSNSFTTI